MDATLHFYDDDGEPPYKVPVLLELENNQHRVATWRWRRDPFEDEWDDHGQSVLKRVLRWAYLPSGDPRKDGKRAQRAIALQVQTLTEQAAKAFAEQVRPPSKPPSTPSRTNPEPQTRSRPASGAERR